MKLTPQTLLAIVCGLFGSIVLYTMFFGDGGADGLSGFITLVIFGILFLASIIGLIVSFISKAFPNKTKGKILFLAFCFPFIGVGVILFIFSMFNAEYTTRLQEDIAIEKSVNHTKRFKSEALQLEFFHVSGEVVGSSNNKPTVAPVLPKVIDSVLIIPENKDAYSSTPDKLFFVKKDAGLTTKKYLLNIINTSDLNKKKCTLKKVNVAKEFPNLDSETTSAFMLSTSHCSYLDIPVIVQHLFPEEDTAYRKAYFIELQKHKDYIMVIAIYNDILSPNAKIEELSTDNVSNQNKWYNTLRMLE